MAMELETVRTTERVLATGTVQVKATARVKEMMLAMVLVSVTESDLVTGLVKELALFLE